MSKPKIEMLRNNVIAAAKTVDKEVRDSSEIRERLLRNVLDGKVTRTNVRDAELLWKELGSISHAEWLDRFHPTLAKDPEIQGRYFVQIDAARKLAHAVRELLGAQGWEVTFAESVKESFAKWWDDVSAHMPRLMQG